MEGMGECGQRTGMEYVLGALLVCLFWVVVVGVDDLAEKSLLLLFSKRSGDPYRNRRHRTRQWML